MPVIVSRRLGTRAAACDQHRADRWQRRQRERDGLSGRVHQRRPAEQVHRCLRRRSDRELGVQAEARCDAEHEQASGHGHAQRKLGVSRAMSRRGSRKYAASTNRHT